MKSSLFWLQKFKSLGSKNLEQFPLPNQIL